MKKGAKCPTCAVEIKWLEHVAGKPGIEPRPGETMVCEHCSEVCVITDTLGLRLMGALEFTGLRPRTQETIRKLIFQSRRRRSRKPHGRRPKAPQDKPYADNGGEMQDDAE